MCVCVRVCVCVVSEELIQHYDYIIVIFLGFNVYIFVNLVKRCVLTLVCEIQHYKNDRYYYYLLTAIIIRYHLCGCVGWGWM